MNRVCVLGSLNMDLAIRVKHMPKIGETILATQSNKISGGKGANQAVSAARLGSEVYMIGKVGQDNNGEILVNNLKKDGINTDSVYKDTKNPTGTAVITIDNIGNNSIIVIPGSNMNIKKEEVYRASEIIQSSDVLVSQFEVPIPTIIEAFKIAKVNGVITILNPAPAKDVPDELLKLTDIIIPNETEIFSLTKIKADNIDNAVIAGRKLIDKGVKYVIITLGENGAVLISADGFCIIPPVNVKAVDTTAAGDSFIGAISNKLYKKDRITYEYLKKTIPFANKVSSIVVTRKGAQTSLPFIKEIELYI